MILVLCLFIVLVVLGILESFFHKRNVESIPIRILINGTRGKTTVCRMLIKALNDKGIKTLGRTTGSEALIVYSDGREVPVKRRKRANIIEMVSFFRLAKKEKPECVVIECMALSEENQKTIGSRLVCPTHTVILNSYVDHIVEIGKTREETIRVLAKSINKDSVLFATEREYEGYGKEFHLIDNRHFDISSSHPLHDENISAAVDVLAFFGIDEEEALKSIVEYSPDIGLIRDFDIPGGVLFVNSFSVNDPKSMHDEIVRVKAFGKKVNLIFNSRFDREYRVLSFEEALKDIDFVERVYVIGDYKSKVMRHIKHKAKIDAEKISPDDLLELIYKSDDMVYLGLGNIKGDGEVLVKKVMDKGGINAALSSGA